MKERINLGIAGNIGVGKTTLTQKLSEDLDISAIYESVIDNPYLSDFYSNMSRWSFNLQIYFLYNRFQSQVKLMEKNKSFIQDRTIYEDKEIFTLDESVKYFNLEGIGKSPSKLDLSRILSMNEHYIKSIDENELFNQLINYCEIFKNKIIGEKKDKIKKSLSFLKNKAKTLEDIYNNSQYIINDEVNFNKEDLKLIDANARKIISEFKDNIKEISNFTRENLEPIVQELIKSNNTNFKGVGQPLRVALTGSKFGPGIYDIIISLGKEEVEKRLSNKTIS